MNLQTVQELRADRGSEAALRALQQRFDAANLRVQIGTTGHRLKELEAFEREFRDFTGQLRPLIQGCSGSDWPPQDPKTQPRVLAVDQLRLDLRSRIATAFSPYVADPLGTFLNTSLRAYDPRQDKLFCVIKRDNAGEPTARVVSINEFEALVAESESIITAYRRDQHEQLRLQNSMLEEATRLGEEATRDLREERAHDLAKAQASVLPTFRAWLEVRRQSWPWKYVWPFVARPLLTFLGLLIIGAALALYWTGMLDR